MAMSLSLIDPELHGPLRRLPPLRSDRTWSRALMRRLVGLIRTTATPGVAIEQVALGPAAVRVYRPDERRTDAALLWIHGGGMVIGAAAQDDRLCGGVAAHLGMTVVSVEYRLAPEHPYPAPLDDCLAAWDWLGEHAASLGVDPERVVVGGQSAGGGLAAGLVLRLRDAAGRQPLAQWLFCPMIDDRTAARRELDRVGHRVWDNRANRFGWRAYLGVEPGSDRVAEQAAPARAGTMEGLPPTWIGVGDIDLFRDEDAAYAERLRAAGVSVEFRTVPGAPHGFEAWAPSTRLAREHVAAAEAWLAGVVGG